MRTAYTYDACVRACVRVQGHRHHSIVQFFINCLHTHTHTMTVTDDGNRILPLLPPSLRGHVPTVPSARPSARPSQQQTTKKGPRYSSGVSFSFHSGLLCSMTIRRQQCRRLHERTLDRTHAKVIWPCSLKQLPAAAATAILSASIARRTNRFEHCCRMLLLPLR